MNEPQDTTGLSDQTDYWEQVYARGGQRASTPEENSFARQVAALLRPGASVLELGCGPGCDAVYFANNGFRVTAVDGAPSAIQSCRERYGNIPGLTFQTADISRPLPFGDGAFEAIYARLSLHYFPDTVTRALIRECHRVLTASGLLCFMCKSPDDPLYGQGEPIEPDMYRHKGHVRHFFSEGYARELLQSRFVIQTLESRQEDLYGKPSAYVLCITVKE